MTADITPLHFPPLTTKMHALARNGHPMGYELNVAANNLTQMKRQPGVRWVRFWMEARRVYERALTVWPPRDPFARIKPAA